tara:strand:+ start:411 stop:617 length:207 start_codon:yes stop_codon:yes gene_type:complete
MKTAPLDGSYSDIVESIAGYMDGQLHDTIVWQTDHLDVQEDDDYNDLIDSMYKAVVESMYKYTKANYK